MTQTFEIAQAHFDAAQNEYDRVCGMCRDEKSNTLKAIDAKFAVQLAALRANLSTKQSELNDAKIAHASHPWLGRKVAKQYYVNGSYWAARGSYKAIYGIVMICDYDTKYPSNMSCKPKIGEAYVRLLKKDGSVGLKLDSYFSGWKLVDDAEATGSEVKS